MSVDVTDRKALEKWLGEQPREVITGFAARSALRVLPMLATQPDIAKHADDIILPVFRAMALPQAAAAYPARGREVHDAAARAASYAADIAAYAAANAAANAAAYAAFAAADAAAYIAANAANAAAQIDVDSNVNKHAPLWFTGNAAMPEVAGRYWQTLKKQLLALDQNWQVWTNWYEAILSPDRFPPPIEDLEIARATIAEKHWEKGWRHINPLIEGLIDKYTPEPEPESAGDEPEADDLPAPDEVEPQSTAALTFFPGDAGSPIEVDLTAGANRLQSDADAQDRYEEAKRLSQQFIDNFDRDEPGANQAAELLQECRLYLEALQETLSALRPSLTVTRGEYFRSLLAAQENRDDFSTLPELSDKHHVALERIVSAHNVMVQLDPELARRDNARLGPDAQQSLVAPEDGQRILENAVENEIASQQVRDVMAEEAANAPEVPDRNNRVSNRYSEGIKNFGRTVIGKVLAISTAVGGAVAAAYKVGNWLLTYEAWAYNLFAGNPQMITILDRLFDFLKTLPLG